MTTTRDIIQRAFRKNGIVASDDAMTADQATAGLDAINAMMHGWELFGVNIVHTDLALDDEFSMAAKFHEGVVYQLARRISPDYMVPGVDDDAWLRALQVAYLSVPAMTPDSTVMNTPSQRAALRSLS